MTKWTGTPCYIFDIDGTVADLSHRLHYITGCEKDWQKFYAACYADAPIPHMINLVKHLTAIAPIVFVSGRSDECQTETVAWLQKQFLAGPVSVKLQQKKWPYRHFLYMRKAGDHREDYIVKGELLDELIADGFAPIMAFEDRDQVVRELIYIPNLHIGFL